MGLGKKERIKHHGFSKVFASFSYMVEPVAHYLAFFLFFDKKEKKLHFSK